MGDGKDRKATGASDRQVRAHIRRVLKQLLPKGGEEKKGAGDQRRLHEVARAGAISQGGRADGAGTDSGAHQAASSV